MESGLSKVSPPSARLAVRVRKDSTHTALAEIITRGLLDRDRKVLVKDGFAEIPIRDSFPGYQIVSQEKPEFYRRTHLLPDILRESMGSEELDLLPKGWYILGDLIIVRIHPRLDALKHLIAQTLLSIYPRCKAVLRDFGIEGQLRIPVREVLVGDVTVTVHRENGVFFRLDASRIMFSQGNLKERMRMSHVGKDEFVVDMFAGIGYFCLPMSKHSQPSRVLAIELNPLAYHFLRENIRLNRVDDVVEPVLGDCAQCAPVNEADRVIMGMVQVTDRYLVKGIEALRSGGILHYHQTIPSWLYPQAAVSDVVKAANALGWQAEILKCTKVKKYSPGVVHVVVDALIRKGC